MSLCAYVFKKCASQFLSHWESAKPTVFCSEELIFLFFKNQNKSLIFSSGQENSNFHIFLLDFQNFYRRDTFTNQVKV
jgi:hypothetical protein